MVSEKIKSVIKVLAILAVMGVALMGVAYIFIQQVQMDAMGTATQSLDSISYNSKSAMEMGEYMPVPMSNPNGEPYDLTFFENYGVNPFIATEDESFSTFGMDVDTASYTIARRWITDGNMPDKDSIRTEEFINYFSQDYTDTNQLFSINIEGAESYFGQPNYHMMKIGIKAKDVSLAERKLANMVFVVDVSGSMDREDRLELVKDSLRVLADSLKPEDKIGLVVYGSQGRKIADMTSDKNRIYNAIAELKPDGSTNAEQGLRIAYEMARAGFEEGKINRIILCSDGVANVGTTKAEDILAQIKSDADKGITLTTLGFGMGNYNDVMMEKLANHGDGNYYYIDTKEEAERLFSNGATTLLQVIGSDAKIQVEFNTETVDRFRLLGYENRQLDTEDFKDDSVDAGEVGAGQTVTALYEIRVKDGVDAAAKIADVRIRYADLDKKAVEEIDKSVSFGQIDKKFEAANPRFRFTCAVAEFAEILKESYWAKDSTIASVLEVAKSAVSDMVPDEKDTEFVELVKKAEEIEE